MRKAKKIIFIVSIIFIITGIIIMIIGWPIIDTITAKEYFNKDRALRIINNETDLSPPLTNDERFMDYDPGDTIIIIDKIVKIIYNETIIYDKNIESTLIYLQSASDYFFRIKGDITGDFKIKDTIIIKLFVVENKLYAPDIDLLAGNDPLYPISNVGVLFKEKLRHEDGLIYKFNYSRVYNYSGVIPSNQISKPPDNIFYIGLIPIIIGIILIMITIKKYSGKGVP